MTMKEFNNSTAHFVSEITGNMWFFWASLIFIAGLRITHPPAIGEFLLDIENDLQLLLLAVNAVVGAKQVHLLTRLVRHAERWGKVEARQGAAAEQKNEHDT
ncbi:MAG: hypothetical protein LLG02_04850 [Pelosinus sp.]|nr:hypothetical protein [Pelosinus sp.]